MASDRPLRMGMVGGGHGAMIGGVHRMAARLDDAAHLTAGCFGSTPERALASGEELGVPRERNYPTWEVMLDAEMNLPRDQRIEFVSVVTPNHMHFPIARAFAGAGIHVVCDKPMVHTTAQARELVECVRAKKIVFAVMYNYSGYPLVKQMRAMIGSGDIGDIRKVIVEYNQGWLASKIEASGQKQAAWRTDPAKAGLGGAIGDIGSHAEHLVSYATGLRIHSICADLTSFVPGRALDDDANLLVRLDSRNGTDARGVLVASQIEIGSENDFRLRVYGTTGSMYWRQEKPDELIVKRLEGPIETHRRGQAHICSEAAHATRLPPGHPEAFIEAFANIYAAVLRAMREGAGGLDAGPRYDFPDVLDGARGVHFIERAVESAASDRKWTDARFDLDRDRN
jgi:predicted dehydrogenase